ncbi:MAG: type II secretion system F family protein [Betaproteobacteria bacterium]|nr:type II secretion system F family protein [Betaproteobacteria bacterium]NBY04493.1 type II secretion system F family protein [Betaproteobacteria bacterium]
MHRPTANPSDPTFPGHWYAWAGRDAKGQDQSGQMQALNATDVQNHLHAQRIRPLHIKRLRKPSWTKPPKAADVLRFTRQLSTLVQAGIALLNALKVIATGEDNASLRALAHDIMQQIESGVSLHQAMQTHACFDAVYLGMVAAAEASGQLDLILAELANHLEQDLSLRENLKSALTYPLAVLGLAVLVVGVMLGWVVPAFESIFASMGAQLPAPTRIVLAFSRWWVSHGWMLLAAGIASILLLRQSLLRGTRGQYLRDRLALSWPLWGSMLRMSCTSRWARTLSSLMQAGVSLHEAMDISAQASGNLCFAQRLDMVRDDVLTGSSLASALTAWGDTEGTAMGPFAPPSLFAPQVVQMVAVGEATGRLDAMLLQVARMHEAQVQWLQKRISVLMEPAVILVLGVLIGGLVIALYLPIFELGQVL